MTNSEKMLSNIISEYNSGTPSPTLTSQRNMFPLTSGATGELKQTKVTASTSARLAPCCYRSHPQHYPSANRHATPAPEYASVEQFQLAMRDL